MTVDEKTWTQRMADKLERATYRIPKIKMPVTFTQSTTGPYSVLVSPELYYERNLSLAEAVEFFIRYAYPPLGTGHALVYDADGVVVLSYRYDEDADAVAWYGTQGGFHEMGKSQTVDPLQLELAMRQAEDAPWA